MLFIQMNAQFPFTMLFPTLSALVLPFSFLHFIINTHQVGKQWFQIVLIFILEFWSEKIDRASVRMISTRELISMSLEIGVEQRKILQCHHHHHRGSVHTELNLTPNKFELILLKGFSHK